jgi:hypothetical protein
MAQDHQAAAKNPLQQVSAAALEPGAKQQLAHTAAAATEANETPHHISA